MNISIIGAGSFGTALSWHLLQLGHSIKIWCFESKIVFEINRKRTNTTYLPDTILEGQIIATSDFKSALTNTELVILAVPTKFLSPVLVRIANIIPQVPILNVAKGIEWQSLSFVSFLQMKYLPQELQPYFTYLSGPSFAKEIISNAPTAVCVAAKDELLAKKVQAIFSNEYFRVYTTTDVSGVLVGGALKNVIAIAAGIADGLNFGHNTKAALITRGLHEIIRLGVKLGAKTETFAGLSGIGDLMLTCYSDLSRNYSVGKLIGQGYYPQEAIKKVCGTTEIAEGIATSKAAGMLSIKYQVKMPICDQVCAILHHKKSPIKALNELMTRDLKPEFVL